jgi:formylglycine-generating enzyme required for sulfatase activity
MIMGGIALLVVAALAVGAYSVMRRPNAASTSPSLPAVAPPTDEIIFEAGSTPEEISEAMALCQRYQPKCEIRDYESEILREVRISKIEADTTEVTHSSFRTFVKATGHRTHAEEVGISYHDGFVPRKGWNWRNVDGSGARPNGQPPVVHVSQKDAASYCEWAGKRLPTEAEWEFIARGVERRIFPWGDRWDPSRLRWKNGRSDSYAAVGSFPTGATQDGLQDLAGNVWEWTSSRTNAGMSVLKGGAWNTDSPAHIRSAMRLDEASDFTSDDTGFRCVRDL